MLVSVSNQLNSTSNRRNQGDSAVDHLGGAIIHDCRLNANWDRSFLPAGEKGEFGWSGRSLAGLRSSLAYSASKRLQQPGQEARTQPRTSVRHYRTLVDCTPIITSSCDRDDPDRPYQSLNVPIGSAFAVDALFRNGDGRQNLKVGATSPHYGGILVLSRPDAFLHDGARRAAAQSFARGAPKIRTPWINRGRRASGASAAGFFTSTSSATRRGRHARRMRNV